VQASLEEGTTPVTAGVDFVVNCYERNFRSVLQPGVVRDLASAQNFEFERVTVLINNVDNPQEAAALAERSRVDRWFFVSDLLPLGRQLTQFPSTSLRALGHFSDCILAAIAIDGPEWLLYWDADVRLDEPEDWISPSLDRMDGDHRILVANPESALRVERSEAISLDGGFAIGHGFSDTVFLARRTDLAQPIYRYVAPASWRYPLAPWTAVFEQRLDAYMRRTGRLRATRLDTVVRHSGPVGANYPQHTITSLVRRHCQAAVLTRAERWSTHPALRSWPRTTPVISTPE
jgi:hypothetical protein